MSALKNQGFKLCYIDAFAGSGNLNVRGIGPICGSAVRAIDYSFDKYFFIEKDAAYLKMLEDAINDKNADKDVQYVHGDCNALLASIHSTSWYSNHWRGVIFLDPYAMNLNWTSLEAIAKTKAFDVWYLFPLSALTCNLVRKGNISTAAKEKISSLLGTDQWEVDMYPSSPQITLFGEEDIERISSNHIARYIIKRLKTVFNGVSERSKILRIPQNNSPLFLLCFAVSNPDHKAITMALRTADHILTHTE